MATFMIGVGAAPAQATPTATAQAEPSAKTAAAGGYWADTCDYGRACIQLADPPQKFWNMVGCGHHPIRDLYDWAVAHGNAFRVTYVDDRWDLVGRWSARSLDGNNLVRSVWVFCR